MSSSIRSVHWSYLGRVPYADAVELQHRARGALLAGEGPECLFFLEHDPVYTVGRNADAADIEVSSEWLAARGIEVHETDRGGQVTGHGPGQLVGYPILNLDPDRRDVRRYIRDLCEVVIRTVATRGVVACCRPTPEIGVWAGDEKIASIGIHLKRWVTTHGFALNVTTDLDLFSGIVPCGLRGVRMASIESLTGDRPELPAVAEELVGHFADVFDRRMVLEPPAASSPAE